MVLGQEHRAGDRLDRLDDGADGALASTRSVSRVQRATVSPRAPNGRTPTSSRAIS
jgi:hypothetical protein